MVDIQLLEDAISKSGKKKTYLADKMGMSVQNLRLKLRGISTFDTDDVSVLCEELGITRLTDKEKIFFAKNVEKMPTDGSKSCQ